MNIKELISKNLPAIKKLVFEEEKLEANEAKLADGTTIIKWDGELEAGTQVLVVSEEGLTPAPDGTHVLENGTEIAVADGVITEVKVKETEKEEEEEEVIEVEMATAEQFRTLEEKLNNLTEEKQNFANESLTANKALTDKVAKLEDALKMVFEIVEALSAEPQKVEELVPDDKQKKKEDFYNSLEEISKKLNK